MDKDGILTEEEVIDLLDEIERTPPSVGHGPAKSRILISYVKLQMLLMAKEATIGRLEGERMSRPKSPEHELDYDG